MKTILTSILFAALAFAQAPHSNVLTLSWTPSANSDPITGFTLQSAPPCATTGCTGPGTWTTIATLPPTVLTYTDNTPVAGQNTYYQFFAFNPGGQVVSNDILLTTPFSVPSGKAVLSGTPK